MQQEVPPLAEALVGIASGRVHQASVRVPPSGLLVCSTSLFVLHPIGITAAVQGKLGTGREFGVWDSPSQGLDPGDGAIAYDSAEVERQSKEKDTGISPVIVGRGAEELVLVAVETVELPRSVEDVLATIVFVGCGSWRV